MRSSWTSRTSRPVFVEVAEAIAQKGVDVTGFSGSTCGDSATLALVTDNEVDTRRALTDGGWKFPHDRACGDVGRQQARHPGRGGAQAVQCRDQHRGRVPDQPVREHRPHRLRDRQPGQRPRRSFASRSVPTAESFGGRLPT